jgi:hypothetical protein
MKYYKILQELLKQFSEVTINPLAELPLPDFNNQYDASML